MVLMKNDENMERMTKIVTKIIIITENKCMKAMTKGDNDINGMKQIRHQWQIAIIMMVKWRHDNEIMMKEKIIII
jgi:hypothetical protein